MGVLKKPYEISIWEDRLIKQEGEKGYYKEVKLAVIGSDRMTSPNRAYNPILNEKVNGEKTLTFTIDFKYFDELSGEMVKNPFYIYLINERKVKLHYNNEWFEFLIKECEEDSEANEFTYTANELFSLELAKTGYNIELDSSLNNNQGTVIELGKKVLENTDWVIDEENSDLLQQLVQEPLYVGTTSNSFEALNLDTNELVPIESGETIYVFYSYIANKNGKFVQFMRESDELVPDDDNVLMGTNYRFLTDVNIVIENGAPRVSNYTNSLNLFYSNQGYRLVYKLLTLHDPVMDRTVDLLRVQYDDGIQEIYHYTDYKYTASDIVTSYLTNGFNFNVFDNGQLQGWDNSTIVSQKDGKKILQPMSLVTYPDFSKKGDLTLVKDFGEINGYLELKFNDVLGANYENTYFNSGFNDNTSMVDHISAGELFAFRLRYLTSTTQHGDLTPGKVGGIKAIVAKYETVEQECFSNTETANKENAQPIKRNVYKIIPGEIVFDFNEEFVESPNIIDNGTFNSNKTRYLVDKVIQTPSTLYIYRDKEEEGDYVWNPEAERFVLKDSSYANYYMTKARARVSYTNTQLQDPKFKLGVFLYTTDSTVAKKYVYIQDVQLTRYYETKDENGVITPVTIGNVPKATSIPTDFYYLKPNNGMKSGDVTTYGSLKFLASELGINEEEIKPVYNEDCEKVLTIQESKSNCFNILQSICETFECWLDIRVEHEEDGSIKLDSNHNPIKKVAFKKYAGKDNFAGFRNGVNLSSINRTIDSNEIVTKLIVDPVTSEFTDNGSVDIQHAQSNPSGQSTIINFDYYMNQGLITNPDDCREDLLIYNNQLKNINDDINRLTLELDSSKLALNQVTSKVNVFDSLIEEAEKEKSEALEQFSKVTKYEYDEYINKYKNVEEWAEENNYDLTKNDSILDIIAKIYVSSITANNYGGILGNQNEVHKEMDLKVNGAKTYSISVASIPPVEGELESYTTQVVLDDYISGLTFELYDEGGGRIEYQTSPNDRIFEISSAVKYIDISFKELPDKYQIQYYKNNKPIVIDDAGLGQKFSIYDSIEGKFYNRHFKLVPEEDYAQENIGLQEQIDKLIEQKSNLEKEFYKKYSRFLQEGTWSSQDYIDSELYYLDALQVSNTSAKPKVSYTFNVLEVSQLENLESYDFRVGDKTYVEDVEFFGYRYGGMIGEKIIKTPIKEEVIVSEVEWHLDEPDTNVVTIQNYKTQFEDLFQRISATVQTVQRNEVTYPKTSSILNRNGLIDVDLLTKSLSEVGAIGNGYSLSTNGSVVSIPDGLLFRDLSNFANSMKLDGNGLHISTDGGNTWNTAITSEGISADRITAGTINTQNIWIMDGDNPSFRWDKAGLSAYGLNKEGRPEYDLKTYVRFDKYGLYGIRDGENFVANSLEDVQENAHFAVTWDGFFVRNSYKGGGRVGMSSDNDFQITNRIDGVEQEKIKIGALEWIDDYGNIVTTPLLDRAPIKYGIRIKNNNGSTVMETDDMGDLTISGTVVAEAGEIGGMSVDRDALRMNHTIFKRGVGIYSDINTTSGEPVFIISDVDGTATFNGVTARGHIEAQTGTLGDLDVIDTITVGDANHSGTIQSYGYTAGSSGWAIKSNGTAEFQNAIVRGEVNAGSGNFYGNVTVGMDESDNTKPYIIIDGLNSKIKSSNYQDGAGYGWMINSDGDAYFNNITARGAIKTAVFEYAEIQAVGGIFIFRPSSTIKAARISGNDLVLKVEKPLLFAKIVYTLTEDTVVSSGKTYYRKTNYGYEEVTEPSGNPHELEYYEYDEELNNSWCKISNYISDGSTPNSNIRNILLTNGLTHVYKISSINLSTSEVTLKDAKVFVDTVKQSGESDEQVLKQLEGGALVDMGREDGSSNYGIGVNSSDNTVNLPARAISLFETEIDETKNPKISYRYKGILGTLPELPATDAFDAIYNQQMAGTQGIFTNNMYIGDRNQYIAFYEDEHGDKQLRIKANQIVYEVVDEDTGQVDWHDVKDIETEGVPGPAGPAGQDGEDAITVKIDSSAGEVFLNKQITTTLTCTVIKGNGTDITNQVTRFNWIKKKADGTVDTSWSRPLAGNTITITEADVTSKAIFICEVEF